MSLRTLGIQGKLLSFFLVVIIIPLPLLASVVYWRSSGVVKGQVLEQLAWIAGEMTGKVGSALFTAGEQARLLANLPDIRNYLRARAFGLQEDLARQQASLREYFEQFLLDHPRFSHVGFLDDRGGAVAAAPASWSAAAQRAAGDEEALALTPQRATRRVLAPAQTGGEPLVRFVVPVQREEARGLGTEAARAAQELLGSFQAPEGVLVLDMNLTELRSIFASLRIGSRGRAFLLDARGGVLAGGDELNRLNFASRAPADLASLLGRIVGGISGTGEYACLETTCLVAFATLTQEGWKATVVAPQADFTRWVDEMRTLTIIFTALIFVAAVLAAVLFTRQISGPLQELDAAARRVAAGDFSVRVNLARRDEIGRLAETFESMTKRLRDYMVEMEEKQRLQQELSIARSIQASLLPQHPPRLPRLDLQALSLPAREVGGDYYDFFHRQAGRPNERLGLAIGDASGKGVPASLLISMTRSLLRSQVEVSTSPGEAVAAVNRLLFEDCVGFRNFVSIFYAEFEPASLTLRCANAGQLFPLYCRGRDRHIEFLTLPGTPLGVRSDAQFPEATLVLEPEDVLVLYTDGIVEAMDERRRMYSFDRLQRTIQRLAAGSARAIIDAIIEDVTKFCGGEAPNDDMTLIVMKVREGAPRDEALSGTEAGAEG
ncbi:MAG: SpoIIE family protein phosphatase [Candidatus Tectomicrobia bacterium]|nr:SpoIIE family protein phosphatase [Candidatus Tectomicrobia bacterium]